jgi:hypothetical protein
MAMVLELQKIAQGKVSLTRDVYLIPHLTNNKGLQ